MRGDLNQSATYEVMQGLESTRERTKFFKTEAATSRTVADFAGIDEGVGWTGKLIPCVAVWIGECETMGYTGTIKWEEFCMRWQAYLSDF